MTYDRALPKPAKLMELSKQPVPHGYAYVCREGQFKGELAWRKDPVKLVGHDGPFPLFHYGVSMQEGK